MNNNWIITQLCKVGTFEVKGVVANCGMTTDNSGNIYYSEYDNVYRVQDDTIKQTITHKNVGLFFGIVWKDGILYICDYNDHKILKYSLHTEQLSILAATGEKGSTDGNLNDATFCRPCGIAVDKNGDLYITQLHCVRKINVSEGTVITVAGQPFFGPSAPQHKDGPAEIALFHAPKGIAVSENGSIYVADSGNDSIRKIKDGVVSTLTGAASQWFTAPFGLALVGSKLLVADFYGLKIMDIHVPGTPRMLMRSSNEVVCGLAECDGTLFVKTTNKLFKLETVWKKYEKYIWIGCLKEEASYCPLATLPKDVIKEIAAYLNLFDNNNYF